MNEAGTVEIWLSEVDREAHYVGKTTGIRNAISLVREMADETGRRCSDFQMRFQIFV